MSILLRCVIWLIFLKKLKDEEEEDIYDEYINAFVAMGGNPDKSGSVPKQRIIETISSEFGLSIEDFLGEARSDNLDFLDFCRLFDALEETRTITGMGGGASILTDKGRRLDTTQSFTAREKDFEKFLRNHSDFLKY